MRGCDGFHRHFVSRVWIEGVVVRWDGLYLYLLRRQQGMAGMRDGRVSPCFFLVLLLFTESLCSSSSSSSSSSALSSSLEHLALVYKPLLSPELLLSLDSNNNKKEHLEENLDLFSWSLSDAAMEELDQATRPVETGTPPQPPDDAQDCLVP